MKEHPRHGAGKEPAATERPSSACPDPMKLAAYVDDGLPSEERRLLEDHVSRCDDCHQMVRETRRTLAELEPASAPNRWFTQPWLAVAAGVILAVGGAALVWQRAAQPTSAMAGLVEAVGPRRLFEPRLTGGFRFGPLTPTLRGSAGQTTDDIAVLAAAAEARRRAAETPHSENTRALAVAHLLVGQPNEAVSLLERLAKDQGNDPAVWSDLAAAQLVRAERLGRAEDLPRALESASRALELAPQLNEALYNKALALQALNLRGEAAAAWAEYASRGDEWSAAALEHKRRLDGESSVDPQKLGVFLADAVRVHSEDGVESALAQSVEASRLYFEQHILPRAAADQERAADDMVFFGRVFERHTGDSTIRAAAEHLTANLGNADVRAAYADYAIARGHYTATRWMEADTMFGTLAREPAFADSPLQPWAELHVAILAYQSGRSSEASRHLRDLRQRSQHGRVPLLDARVEWVLGLLAVGAGRFDEALRHHTLGGQAFARARDPAHAAYMSFLAGEVLDYLGRPRLAWQRRAEALLRNQQFPEPSRRINVLFLSGDHCASAGLPRAAFHFAREAAAVATMYGTEADRIQSELILARAVSRVRPSEAVVRVRAARARLDAVRDAMLQDRVMGEMQSIAAEVGLATNAPDSKETLDRAINWLAGRRAWARLAPLYLRRGLLRRQGGDEAGARTDLQQVVHLVRAMRSPAEDLRVSHASVALAAYDQLLLLQLDGNSDPLEALVVAEGRWEAADVGQSTKDAGALIGALVNDLAADAAVLAFVPTDQELIAWLVRPGEAKVVRRRVARDEIERLVLSAIGAAKGAGTAGRVAPDRLSEILLGPHEAGLMGVRRLFVVPAGPLWRLPFGLLRDAGGTHLFERTTVAVVPSLAAVQGDRAPAQQGRRRLLALGFMSGAADLPILPRVDGELHGVAVASGITDVVIEPLAKRDALSRLASGTSVIHFAGHSTVNEERPIYSSLIVAAEGGGDDYLTAREIALVDLTTVDVVTLSTCAAAATSATYGEGPLSVARAFLVAGARAVIAPLWEVSDQGMPALMARLHRALAAGASPAEAVTQVVRWAETQSAEIRSDARSLIVLTGHNALARSN